MKEPVSEDKVDELISLMSGISEDCWAAGWIEGLEYTLWQLMQNGGGSIGMWWRMTPDEAATLKELSDSVDGWVWWSYTENNRPELDGPRYISMEEWLKHLELRLHPGRRINDAK